MLCRFRAFKTPAVRALSSGDPLWLHKAQVVDAKMRLEHNKVPDDREARVRRLVYRAKQRGWLEVDLLMGSYAEHHAKTMSDKEVNDFEALLAHETTDAFKFLTGELEPPEGIKECVEAVKEFSLRKVPSTPSEYADFKSKHKLSN